jgi:hypothetical protein
MKTGTEMVVGEKADSMEKMKGPKTVVALSDGISQNQGENMGTVKMPDKVFSK